MVLPAMIQQAAIARNMRANANGGRLSLLSATEIILEQWTGEVVEVNDELVPLTSSGYTLNRNTNTCLADGTDSGLPPTAGSLYYICLSNSRCVDFPQQLVAVLFGAAVRSASGVRYVGAAGSGGDNLRILGLAQLSGGAGQFRDSATERKLINYENQIPRHIKLTPGYTDDNAQTNVARVAAVWASLNGGVGDNATFLSDGESPIVASMHVPVVAGTAGAISHWGISIDTLTQPSSATVAAVAAANVCVSVAHSEVCTEGSHYVAMVCMTGAAGATWACDLPRNGSTVDPVGAHLVGWIMG